MKLITTLLMATLTACTGPAAAPKAQPSPTPGEIECGVFELKQRQELPEAAMRCIIDAAAQGRQARLQETRPTIEGDPIVTWYRVGPTGAVEVTRDTTKDKFGNRGIVTESCTGPAAEHGMLTFASCVP
jgi:hypothetical protein